MSKVAKLRLNEFYVVKAICWSTAAKLQKAAIGLDESSGRD